MNDPHSKIIYITYLMSVPILLNGWTSGLLFVKQGAVCPGWWGAGGWRRPENRGFKDRWSKFKSQLCHLQTCGLGQVI